jgi:hypothetical protein
MAGLSGHDGDHDEGQKRNSAPPKELVCHR